LIRQVGKSEALFALKTTLGSDSADFKDGQWEAIDKIVNQNKKLLVVQKTGWGKSIVYFLATKFKKEQGLGITLIVSPLLALMRNQVQSAKNIGITADTINSSNTLGRNEEIKKAVLDKKIDALLISPERLANEEFVKDVLLPLSKNIGLFVIDEAHCISDWGHDFRPDYKRIVSILRHLPPNVPVLATTATANDRVVADIENQIGDIETLRGALTRESLGLQNIILPSEISRLAWLSKYTPTLKGSGIVYVLTKRDAKIVSSWLNKNGISAEPYFGGDDNSDENSIGREELENKLLNNELKVLVATTALGMGFDKSDLGFVIHYQAPGSIVAYYQQVGRAGRGIDYAVGILMSGREDDEIHDYFRQSAFPSKENVEKIIKALENSDGLKERELEGVVNIKSSKITAALKFLNVENNPPIFKDGLLWKRTPHKYKLDEKKIAFLVSQKTQEWQSVQEYIQERGCLMRSLANSLNDMTQENCGKCVNCLGTKIISTDVDGKSIEEAALFLKRNDLEFKSRKKMPDGKNIPKELLSNDGRILSRWADAGWGELVASGKRNNHFSDELVDAMVDMIKNRWNPTPFPVWITSVPSLRRPTLVPDFARRLGEKLGIKFVECVKQIRENNPQKMQQNSHMQVENLKNVFEVDKSLVCSEPLFLFDDVADSKWTMAIISQQLRVAGSGTILPVVLSTTAKE